jgi:hypothetical protein
MKKGDTETRRGRRVPKMAEYGAAALPPPDWDRGNARETLLVLVVSVGHHGNVYD